MINESVCGFLWRLQSCYILTRPPRAATTQEKMCMMGSICVSVSVSVYVCPTLLQCRRNYLAIGPFFSNVLLSYLPRGNSLSLSGNITSISPPFILIFFFYFQSVSACLYVCGCVCVCVNRSVALCITHSG